MSGILELLNLPTDTRSGDKEVLKKINTVNHNLDEELQSQLDKYECITDKERLHEFIDKVVEKGMCAVDTETMGLNPMTDDIVGISMYIEGEKGVYIPLNHVSHITLQRLPKQITLAEVAKELERIKSVSLIWHNYAFDRRVIKHNLGIILPCYWDTRTAWKYLNENESSALKVLYGKHIDDTEDFETKTFSKLFQGKTFDRIPLKYATAYAGGDAVKTYKLYEFEKSVFARNEILQNLEKVYLEVDLPIQEVIAEMMDNGTKYDFEESAKLLAEFEVGIKRAETKINNILERDKGNILAYKSHHIKSGLEYPINLNSPKQIGMYLYDIKGYPLSKDGAKSTGVADLKRINDDFCQALLEYRELEKITSTYLRSLPQAVNTTTGRIHTTYDAFGAVTGRMSSKNPNLQQIPSRHKEIRNIFVADKGNVFVSADYSQQEPRILAYCSQDKEMIKAFTTGKDIYSWVASIVYRKTYEECLEHNPDGTVNKEGKRLRGNFKGIILGIMYGRSAAGIAENLKIDIAEAQAIIDDFYKAFPTVQRWQLKILSDGKKNGYVQTILGRKRRLPDLRLMPYDLKAAEGYTSVKDIFDFDNVSIAKDNDISDEDYNYFMKALVTCKSWKRKQEIIQEASKRHISITENRNKIADAERQAVNSVIQGSAAEMTKLSLLEVYNNQKLKDYNAKLVMQIHDELIIECPKEHADECARLLQECMINAARKMIDIPMKCDTTIAERWGDL